MKQCLLLFGLSLVLFSCGNGGSAPAQGVSVDLSGFEMTAIPGTAAQRAVKKAANGIMLEEGIISAGMRNGIWTTYYPENGVVQKIESFVNDVYSGPFYKFNNRGQLEESGSYINNMLDGRYAKIKFGRTTEEIHYKMNQYHGLYRTFFNNSDRVQKEQNFKDNKLHGMYRVYNEEGLITLEAEYSNGEKVSGGILDTPKAPEAVQ